MCRAPGFAPLLFSAHPQFLGPRHGQERLSTWPVWIFMGAKWIVTHCVFNAGRALPFPLLSVKRPYWVLGTLLACITIITTYPKEGSSMLESDRYQPTPYIKIKHPEWSKNAVIYQINTRQFTAEGTFAAAEKRLPRLKELGADILWLMPIHEIGQKHRKGNLVCCPLKA
jgi:hypothetical protein